MPDSSGDDMPAQTSDLRDYRDLGITPGALDRLEASAHERFTSASTRRRWNSSRLKLTSTGIGVAVTLATIGGVATAATGLWSPPLGGGKRGDATLSASPVPKDQHALLGVLRREQTPSDRGERVRQELTRTDADYQGIRTNEIRLLVPGDSGLGVMLIPVKRWAAGPIDDAICVERFDSEGAVGNCWSTEQIRTGQAVNISIASDASYQARVKPILDECASLPPEEQGKNGTCKLPTDASGQTYIYDGPVPDGVARVVGKAGDQTRSASVRNNYFRTDFTTSETPTFQWLDAAGHEIEKPRK